MNARGRHRRWGLVAVLLFAALPTAPAAGATADGPVVAIMVHLAGGPTPEVPAGAAELRAAALDLLGALSGARGVMTADRALTEELVRRHRIRTGGALNAAFLADVRDELGAGTLLAVTILSDSGRLAASARAIDTTSGRLTAVGLSEVMPSDAPWRTSLTEALRRAYPTLAPAADGPLLLVLPARAVGLDPQAARAATSCVLSEAVAGRAWSVLDPALVAGAIADAGRDLNLLDKESRTLLAKRCGVTWAVVPEVVSYGLMTNDGAGRLPSVEDSGWEPRPVADLSLTLQLLDLRTGLIRAAVSVTVSGDTRTGWFGVTSQVTELDQLRAAAAELWARFQRSLEEQNS